MTQRIGIRPRSIGVTILLGVPWLGLLAGCGDSAAPFANLGWQLQCSATSCTPYTPHEIKAHDMEEGHQVECRVEARDNGVSALYLKANKIVNNIIDYGVEIANASFQGDGGNIVLTGCTMTIRDDARYMGRCGSEPVSALQPCQIRDLVVSKEAITGSFLCSKLVANSGAVADVAGVGGSAMSMFRFENCTGL